MILETILSSLILRFVATKFEPSGVLGGGIIIRLAMAAPTIVEAIFPTEPSGAATTISPVENWGWVVGPHMFGEKFCMILILMNGPLVITVRVLNCR